MIYAIQTIARMVFRAWVISLLLLQINEKFIWAIPVGILIGIGTEAKSLVKENKQ